MMEVIKPRRLERIPTVLNGMFFKVESVGDIEVSTKPPQIPTKTKIPVLGPTRQDTELYFKVHNKPRERNVTYLKSRSKTVVIGNTHKQPTHGTIHSTSTRRTNSTLTELTTSNILLSQQFEEFVDGDSAAQSFSGKTRVLVTRESGMQNGRRTVASDCISDLRWRDMNEFKSGSKKFIRNHEVHKPKQRNQKKVKILEPSKHGYHPRSFSPTYRRLVKVQEKLMLLKESNSTVTDFEEYILELTSLSADEFTESESRILDIPADRTKAGIYSCASKNNINGVNRTENHVQRSNSPRFLKHNDKTQSSSDKNDEKLSHILRNSTNRPKELKNVKSKPVAKSSKDVPQNISPTELHLYLPQIHADGMSDTVSHNGEYIQTSSSDASHPQYALTQLPKIQSSFDETNSVYGSKRQSKIRKRTSKPVIKVKDPETASDGSNGSITKKKSKGRAPSGHKNEVVQDFLNDIPTWVSMTYNSEDEAP